MKRGFGSIRLKIVSVIILVLAASIALSTAIMVGGTREALLGTVRRNLAVNNEILNSVIRNLMLSGEAPIAVQTLGSLKSLEEFQEISIYRADGTTAFNDLATIRFVNDFQDKFTFSPTERTERLVLSDANFRRVLETNTPREVESPEARKLEYYFPILNAVQCRSCHGDTPFVRGVAYYKISTARAYERVNQAGLFLGGLLATMGVAIAILLILLMQRIVVTPILAIGSTVAEVGAGNLEVSIDLETRDELGTLAHKINDMIDGLKLRNRLLIENKTIEARNQENRKYLDNIGQGLLLLDREYRIREQYSAFLIRLFGRPVAPGTRFSDFIFPEPGAEAERRELDAFLSFVFNNTLTEMEMIQAANPLRDKSLRVPDGRGREREIVVDVGFARIMEGETVESVMVIFEDRTQIVRTQEELTVERERRDAELEEIAAILRAGPSSFTDFAREAQAALATLASGYERLGDPAVVASLFRLFHSLKGSARYLELRGIERRAHGLETLLAGIRDENRDKGRDALAQAADRKSRRLELEARAAELGREVEGVLSIVERFRSFLPGAAAQTEVSGGSDFLRRIESMALSLGAELGKELEVSIDDKLGSLPRLEELKNPLIHLVRNAVDHGLEAGLERVAAGKSATGKLTIRVYAPAPGEAAVEVEDDGRGIDFEAVRKKALARGLLAEGEEADRSRLLRFLFLSDFSLREAATTTSGRGVGLDAVAEAMKAIGGRISVATGEGRGSRFTLRFPIKES